jgi:hypothetical protein
MRTTSLITHLNLELPFCTATQINSLTLVIELVKIFDDDNILVSYRKLNRKQQKKRKETINGVTNNKH